jgi:hypothetical protein
MREPWGNGIVNLYVQLADNADLGEVSLKIRDEQLRHLKPLSAKTKPALFLQPMSKWHLYSQFKDGKKYRWQNTICVAVWYCRGVCTAAGLY